MRASLIVAFTAAALAAPAALAADTVVVRAVSGQTFQGTIDSEGDAHAYLLEDFAPQTFSILLKAAKGSALVPDLTLEDPAAGDVTASLAAFRKDGSHSVAVKNAAFPSGPGRYVLRVLGKTGATGTTGGYLLKVTTKVVKKFTGTGSVPGSPDIAFFAPSESVVSLKVTPTSPGAVSPLYGAVTAPSCVSASVLPGLKTGTGTLAIPFTGDYSAEVEGNGGTEGAFQWLAKVKPAKPSKIPVQVNGGAVYFPPDGPGPAAFVTRPGQSTVGFDTDGVALCWREVRTQSNPPQQAGKNSIACSSATGKNLPKIANNFATDGNPPANGFSLGPTDAAVVAGGELFAIPRAGGSATSLGTGLGAVLRVLADDGFAYAFTSGGIRRYPLDGSGSSPVITDGSYTYLDMAFGGKGLVFAAQDGAGDLVVVTVGRDGTGSLLLATVSSNPGLRAFAARGPDAFFAVNDGAGGTQILRASSCFPGTAVPLAALANAPVSAMAADELAVYVIEDDAADGVRVRQVPRGGGVPTVIARGNDATGFAIQDGALAAAKGYVYFLADDGGDAFYRVKRR